MSIFKDKVLMITGGTGSFGNAVLNRPHLLGLIDFPLIDRYRFRFQRAPFGVEGFKRAHVPADVHHLIGARSRRRKLINGVIRREPVDVQRDLELIVGAVVEVDVVAEGCFRLGQCQLRQQQTRHQPCRTKMHHDVRRSERNKTASYNLLRVASSWLLPAD